jgi:uncharacterized protein (DUF2249 family)
MPDRETVMTTFVDLDVRPALRAGGEPFEEIMATVGALKPGEGLRLLATFKPTPLFHVLGAKGFTPAARELDGGDWEVLFTPSAGKAAAPGATAAPAPDGSDWPAAVRHLDNRDLDPPEPMVRILETVEAMAPGEVLSALLCREPIFLFPELAKRGHRWRGAFEDDGKTYKVFIRVGALDSAA